MQKKCLLLPGFYVTHPSDEQLYHFGMTEGPPDRGVYQLAPYGRGTGQGIDVGYRLHEPPPASPNYAPVSGSSFGSAGGGFGMGGSYSTPMGGFGGMSPGYTQPMMPMQQPMMNPQMMTPQPMNPQMMTPQPMNPQMTPHPVMPTPVPNLTPAPPAMQSNPGTTPTIGSPSASTGQRRSLFSLFSRNKQQPANVNQNVYQGQTRPVGWSQPR